MWGIAIISIFVLLYCRSQRSQARYPPGPPGLPFLGNLFQLETTKPWHAFAKWKDTYGPITYINVLGQPMFIINSKQAAEDLLERRSLKYSARSPLIVLSNITKGLAMAFTNDKERWRKMRRASENALGPRTASIYHRVQSFESVLLAHGILNDPRAWKSHLERTSSSTALSMIYALPSLQTLRHPSVHLMDEFADSLGEAALPGAHLVEIFPTLQYLPRFLSKWRRDAEEQFKKFDLKFEEMFLRVKNEVLSGHEHSASFCSDLVENRASHKMSDQECSWLSGALYGAGHETTTTTISWFLFSMILYPVYQQKAQEELDRVVGNSRLPSFADFKHLPYIRAIVKEVLRWRPALPLAVPHISTEDDYYNGYFIPKGSAIVPVVLSLNHDPEIYGQDADQFNPGRYLNEDGNLKDETNEGHYTYGFGARNCAGRHVANNTLFIEIATILWTMRLEAAKDSNGNVIKPDVNAEEDTGIFSRPPSFEFVATARFTDAEALIQQSRDEIMDEVLSRISVTNVDEER